MASDRARIQDLAAALAKWLEKPRTPIGLARASRLLGALSELAELERQPTAKAMPGQSQLRSVAVALGRGAPLPRAWRARRSFNSAKTRLHTVNDSLRGVYRKKDPRPRLERSIASLWRAIAWDDNAFKHRDEELDVYAVASVGELLRAADDAVKRLTSP